MVTLICHRGSLTITSEHDKLEDALMGALDEIEGKTSVPHEILEGETLVMDRAAILKAIGI